jgi:cytochrome P450
METATAKKPLPPFPDERHWLFGSAYLIRQNALVTLDTFIKKYGDIMSLSIPTKRIALVSNPEYAKYILLDNNKNYTKSLAYNLLQILLGKGLLTSEGDFWKKQRRLIQPAFHRKKLEELTAMMVARAEQTADKFEIYASDSRHFDIVPEMTALTLDVISKAIFSSGVEEKADMVGKQISLLNQYTIEKLTHPLRLPFFVPTPFNLKERKAINLLNEVVYDIISARKKEGVSKDDLLSMLIDARDEDTGETMSDQQLRDELMTIFVAGNETSSMALSWTLYLLSQNPDAEAKILAEIDSRREHDVNYNTINEYVYVKQVIEESMRMYPPVWSVGRRTIDEDEIGGYRILKHTNILIPIIWFHHSPKYWQEPHLFRPERFEPEKRNNINRYVYFPFGGGPRLCIGNNFAMLEMQIILVALYRRFRFRLQENFKVVAEPLVTLRAKNGIVMKAVKR